MFSGVGPMKAMPSASSRRAKLVFSAEEAVAGVNGLSARRLAGGDHGIDVEVRFRGRSRPEAHGFIGELHRLGEAIGIGIDRDRGDAHAPAACRMTRTAISPRLAMRTLVNITRRPSTSTWMGVGLKPLQGLLICGQLEMTQSTSISATSST